MKVIHFHRVSSTNTVALDLARREPDPHCLVVRADRQSGGRGQHGRSFASPAGGLYCSLVLCPRLELARLAMVTLAAGVGCCLALEETAALAPRLKWPNDLYLGGRKLAGILTETAPVTAASSSVPVVIGIGMNVNNTASDMPPELREGIVSLRDMTGRSFDLDRLLRNVVLRVREAVRLLENEPAALLARWRQRDCLVGRRIELSSPGRSLRGQALGLADDGRYRLLAADGSEHLVLAGSLRPVPGEGPAGNGATDGCCEPADGV